MRLVVVPAACADAWCPGVPTGDGIDKFSSNTTPSERLRHTELGEHDGLGPPSTTIENVASEYVINPRYQQAASVGGIVENLVSELSESRLVLLAQIDDLFDRRSVTLYRLDAYSRAHESKSTTSCESEVVSRSALPAVTGRTPVG